MDIKSKENTKREKDISISSSSGLRVIIAVLFIWLLNAMFLTGVFMHYDRYNGYYKYGETYFYKDNNTWYSYDVHSKDDWDIASQPDEYDGEDISSHF